MSDIHTRLKEVRNHFKLSIREFSKEIHFSHSLYGITEHGDRPPNDRIIELICSKFKVNKTWILTGNGDMFDDSPKDLRLEKILEIYDSVDDVYKNFLLSQSKLLLELHRKNKET